MKKNTKDLQLDNEVHEILEKLRDDGLKKTGRFMSKREIAKKFFDSGIAIGLHEVLFEKDVEYFRMRKPRIKIF
jgi:hypothetical protein